MADNSIYSLERAFALLTTYGYASPNKYFVSFYNLPTEVSTIPTISLSDQGRLKLACEAVDLPVKNITTDDLKIGKHIRKSAIGYTVDPIKLTYRCSRDMVEKVFFDKWLDLICDPITGAMEYHQTFTSDVIIEVLDGGGEPIYAVQLHEAFPISVSGTGLSYQSVNEAIKVDIQLAYTRLSILNVGIAGANASSVVDDINNLRLIQAEAALSAEIDSDRVRTREPEVITLGTEAKAFLETLGIPHNNPAYEWNSYLSDSGVWGTDDPSEALSKLSKAREEINSPTTKSAIENGGQVAPATADNAIDILTDQADSVLSVIERISPFTVYF